MYERSKAMGAFLAVLIIAEGTVILTGAALYKRVPVPPGYPGCAAYYEEGPEGHLAAAGYICESIAPTRNTASV